MNTRQLQIFILGFLVFATANLGVAQPVTLTGKDGKLTIHDGQLYDFDQKLIQIETPSGRLTLRQADVDCSGPGCPDPQDRTIKLSFVETSLMSKNGFLILLKSFANQTGKTLRVGSDQQIEVWDHYPEPIASIEKGGDSTPIQFVAGTTEMPAGFGVVHLLSKSTTVSDGLSAVTLFRIWTGDISNWSQLGGPEKPIRLLLPIESAPIHVALKNFNSNISTENLSPNAQYFLGDLSIEAEVDRDELAIGFTTNPKNLKQFIPLKLGCGESMDAPNDPQYPLIYPIGIDVKEWQSNIFVQELTSFISSISVQQGFGTSSAPITFMPSSTGDQWDESSVHRLRILSKLIAEKATVESTLAVSLDGPETFQNMLLKTLQNQFDLPVVLIKGGEKTPPSDCADTEYSKRFSNRVTLKYQLQ